MLKYCIIGVLGGSEIVPVKLKKINLKIFEVILFIICTAIGVLKYSEYTATRTIEASVTVGKDNINVNCHGKGEPTVIFESGLGCTNASWIYVQPEISKMARTFSYDRKDDGRTTLDQVHELHALLVDTKVKGPYIIVAHSIGGLNARVFAGTYPSEVAGIIFVDSSHEDQFANPKFKNNTPPFDIDAKQVKKIREKDALRNIPIIVLTADEEDSGDIRADWINYQNDIASLSNKSKHIVLNNSQHFIQSEHPDVVIDAIKEMIKEIEK